MILASMLYDTGPGIGLGHQRRMEALGAALQGVGVSVELRPLPAQPGGGVLVVDSYRRRADELSHLLPTTTPVVAIDDLERDLEVDLVVDPNPGASSPGPTAAGRELVGASFALIHPSVLRATTAPLSKQVSRVLVTTGAADTKGTGAGIAGAIAAGSTSIEVSMLVGPWSTTEVPPRVSAVANPPDLASHLAVADIVVTAAGVTMLESLALGRPTVAVVTAPNQQRGAKGAADAGAILLCPIDGAATGTLALADDWSRRMALARTGSELIDGRGPRRVAEAILDLLR